MFSVDLTISEYGGRAVVALRGELDAADAVAVTDALTAAADRERVVIADLAGLTFIDASGVAALRRARRHAREVGGDLVLAGPRRRIRRVLAVAQRADVFSIHADVAEAVASMAGSSAAGPAAAASVLLPATLPAAGPPAVSAPPNQPVA
jgi:anti-sigma B factor antagonist